MATSLMEALDGVFEAEGINTSKYLIKGECNVELGQMNVFIWENDYILIRK
jgi:hypothetical protein